MMKNITRALLSTFLTLILFSPAFAQSEKKVAYGILIDNTFSLRMQFPEVVMIGKGVVERIHNQGLISLFIFETQKVDKRNSFAMITPGTEWNQDKHLLGNYIENLAVVPGQTALMDAINSMAAQLNEKVNLDKNAFGGKVIFLITDGEDRVSKIKEKQLIKILKESGITVYAVGLVKELDEGGFTHKSPKKKAIDFLERITKETSGRAIFQKSKKDDVNSLLTTLFAK